MCSGGGAVGWGTVLQATPPRTVGACPNQDGHCLTFTRYSHNANEFSQFQWLCVCGRSFLRRVDHSSRRILRSVVCLWSWSFNRRRSWPTRDCCAMGISSIFLRAPSSPMKQGTTHFPIHQPLFACITLSGVWQVLSSNASWSIFYKTLRCWSHWCLPVPPTARHDMYEHSSHVQQKGEMQCWESYISHSSYPWLLALRDLLLMNKHPTRLLRIKGCGRKFYSYIYLFI